MQDPRKPICQKVEEHELNHLLHVVYREKGRKRLTTERAQGVSEVHMDIMLLGPKGEAGEAVPCLVLREVDTKMMLAAAMPRKTTGNYIAEGAVAFMKVIGRGVGDVVVKSDQEPAMMTLVEDSGGPKAAGGSLGTYWVESSPVGSNASNGVVERSIRTVEGQIRVMKIVLEKGWATQLFISTR